MRRPDLRIFIWLAIVLVLIIAFISFTGQSKIKAIEDLKAATKVPEGVIYIFSGDGTPIGQLINQSFLAFYKRLMGRSSPGTLDANFEVISKTQSFHDYIRLKFFGEVTVLSFTLNHGYDIKNTEDALSNFSELKAVVIEEFPGTQVLPDDWAKLCRQMHQHSELVHLVLRGAELTGTALIPLQNHPAIETIHVSPSQLTKKSAVTFKTLPKLKELNIFTPSLSELSDSDIDALIKSLQAELPSVTVKRHY